jgi:hypothetical protein
MNCFAGLALMKILTSDQPKTEVMKTEESKLTVESKKNAALFRVLFLFQIELSKYVDGFENLREFEDVIESMDRLMQRLLEMTR